ncbi:flagellar biosynthetic protein FliO [Bacillus benzoevorans]|uniref:Flagellar protein FliO/FliZ n=1 Tax=Bacillus benzoevorans TaxID=1456 RepID=A0A7X0HQP3_9BACI|nr:flagellar biosynthetic protein FliO [Bacillus benzoevorans]MBB6443855.1 flagellar protein FliO/FliZ [Bacillus benzoevorans]
MVPKVRFYFIGLMFLLALLGGNAQVYAEQVNNSVKDCIEKPETCGEQQVSPQKGDKNTANRQPDQLNSTPVSEETAPIGLTIWDFGKMILATIFVVVLLYFVLKFVNKKSTMFKSSQLIENLGGVPLGANRSVQIIKIGSRLFIVGVGENIQLLKEIEDEKEFTQIVSEYNSKLDQLVQPNVLFAKIMNKVNKRKADSLGAAPPFQSMLKQQLTELAQERKKIYEEVEKSEGTDKP